MCLWNDCPADIWSKTQPACDEATTSGLGLVHWKTLRHPRSLMQLVNSRSRLYQINRIFSTTSMFAYFLSPGFDSPRTQPSRIFGRQPSGFRHLNVLENKTKRSKNHLCLQPEGNTQTKPTLEKNEYQQTVPIWYPGKESFRSLHVDFQSPRRRTTVHMWIWKSFPMTSNLSMACHVSLIIRGLQGRNWYTGCN